MSSHAVNLSVFETSLNNMYAKILPIWISALIYTLPDRADTSPIMATSRQYIPPVPGLIPVYIRHGDTPLEDINLDLAEAFDSYEQHARFGFARSNKIDEVMEVTTVAPKKKESTSKVILVPNRIPLVHVNTVPTGGQIAVAIAPVSIDYQHIQKIPKTRQS